jgi:trans-aconitate 2-methyltransferase
MSKTTADYYNDFAQKQLASGIHHRHLAIMRWLKKFDFPKSGNILEIGCGVGTQTELLLRYLDLKSTVTAIDISDKSIHHARQRLARYSNVKLITGDIVELDFNEKFNTIILPDVLEHIPLNQHDKLFKKLASLVQKEGFILIHIPHPNYLRWLSVHKPEELQIIDNPIYTDQLLNHVYKHGLFLHYLESYNIYADPCDYQIIILKKDNKSKEYQLIEPKAVPFYERVQNRLKYLLRGKK